MKEYELSGREGGLADQYRKVEMVARTLGVSVSYLNKARLSGDGPPYVKFNRNVRYNISKVLAWAEARERTSTSDPGQAR